MRVRLALVPIAFLGALATPCFAAANRGVAQKVVAEAERTFVAQARHLLGDGARPLERIVGQTARLTLRGLDAAAHLVQIESDGFGSDNLRIVGSGNAQQRHANDLDFDVMSQRTNDGQLPRIRLATGIPAQSHERSLQAMFRGLAYQKRSNIYAEGADGIRRSTRQLTRGYSRVGADIVVERADYTRYRLELRAVGDEDSRTHVVRYYLHQGGARTRISGERYVDYMKTATSISSSEDPNLYHDRMPPQY